MRCVLPWLDSWAAKKPDAAAFEDEKNVPDVAAAARYGETHRHLSGAAAPAARSRCAVHGQKPDDCRGDAWCAGSWVLLYHH